MAKDGTKNLIPASERSLDEARKNGRKGGIKSGEVRRERKKLKDELLILLGLGDTQEKMCMALIQQATEGNTKAFEIIRDTIGEKPIEAIDDKGKNNGVMPDVLEALRNAKNNVEQ